MGYKEMIKNLLSNRGYSYTPSILQDIASFSPSYKCKVGAVIVVKATFKIIAAGFNHHPNNEPMEYYEHNGEPVVAQGVNEAYRGLRMVTYDEVIHAEIAALEMLKECLDSSIKHTDLLMFITRHPCSECEKAILSLGIQYKVVSKGANNRYPELWDIRLTPLKGRRYMVDLPIELLVDGVQYVVPRCYITNGADIPRIFWSIIEPYSSDCMAGVVVHDYLTDLSKTNNTTLPFKTTDKIFYTILTKNGVHEFKRKVMYFFVRLYHKIRYRD